MKPTSIPALADIDIPTHLSIEQRCSLDDLMRYAGEQSLFGTGGRAFFGTAYIQGNRLMFTTAMPLDHLVDVSRVDRSRKKDNVEQVMEHSNRPAEATHGKNLNQYLRDTACLGENWIIPSLTLNYGCGLGDDDDHIRMIVLANHDAPGITSWPAIVLVPPGARFDITDGAHRESQFEALLKDARLPPEQKDRLRQNAVSVNFVFEQHRAASHQDFADCAKAKAIQKSLVVTFDVRDLKNRVTRDLVKEVPFLAHYVDATAANVNLSGKSKKVWSMSAMRIFTTQVQEEHPNGLLPLKDQMQQSPAFFRAAIERIPVLARLAQNMQPVTGPGDDRPSTGQLRENRGGNVLLRGVGLAILARAYTSSLQHGIAFEDMADALSDVDWHVLTIDKPLPTDPLFREKIGANLSPLFGHMVSATESRMKISSSSSDADIAWVRIVQSVPFLADRIEVHTGPDMFAEAAE